MQSRIKWKTDQATRFRLIAMMGLLVAPLLCSTMEIPNASIELAFGSPVSISQGPVKCIVDQISRRGKARLSFRYQIQLANGHNIIFRVSSELLIRFLDKHGKESDSQATAELLYSRSFRAGDSNSFAQTIEIPIPRGIRWFSVQIDRSKFILDNIPLEPEE